jgi:Tol biopolymer transport system component/DNA-binding winged helix-turn-helix (wHTH) protein
MIYELEGFRLDPRRRELSRVGGEPVPLRGKAFDALLYLVERAGRPVEKTELFEAVWPKVVVEDNSLNQTISALRTALGDSAQSPRFIATLTGRGYQFIGAVRALPDTSAEPQSVPAQPVRAPARRRAAFALAAVATVAVVAAAIWATSGAPDGANGPPASGTAQLFAARGVLVSDFGGSHLQPTLSPDGTMLAFASNASGAFQIWIKNLAGGDPRLLTQGPEGAAWPTWSPRGDQILFHRLTAGVFSIWSIDPLGTREPRRLVERGATQSFSPDGASFVYQGQNREIWIAAADGSAPTKVEGVPGGPGLAQRMPAFSADGRNIVFVHSEEGPYGDLWVIPSTGGEARRLTTNFIIDQSMGAPAPMSDGFVVFAAAEGLLSDGPQLWRVPIAGGPVEQLTTGVGGYRAPVISRDGTRAIYAHSRPVWRLMRTDLRTLDSTSIYESRTPIVLPVVSHDGRDVAFFSQIPSGLHVFTIDVDGQNLRQRTFDEGGANTLPAWAHDGSLYYYRDRSLHKLAPTAESSLEVLPDFHWSSRNFLAVHVDKIAYHAFGDGNRRGVIRDLASELEIELPDPVVRTMQWSKDGKSLLGFRDDGTIVVCTATGDTCDALAGSQGPIRGNQPYWSLDETRIFFRRPAGRTAYSALWVVDRDGANAARLLEFGPLEGQNSYYAVAADDTVVWNQLELTPSEIWMSAAD